MNRDDDCPRENCLFEGSLVCCIGGGVAGVQNGGGDAPIDEAVWVEVIRKMDEVYADLVRNEIDLERKNEELQKAYESLSEAHETLKRTQQQLVQSEKLASLGRLVAGVAHELNNPLSFVLGNTHALRKYLGRIHRYLDAVDGGTSGEALAGLRRELRLDATLADLAPLIDGTVEGADRARDIVESLRRFSAIDHREEEVFDLAEVVERSVLWVCKAVPKRFEVVNSIEGPLPVKGSPSQMQQVVINLVRNAYDAAAESGEPRLDIVRRSEGGRIAIEFRDNGPGIAPEDLGRLFDPFFTTKPVGKGTGLGLSISFGIVERHGGRLTAANAGGGGAAFTLTLPRAKP